MTDKKVKIYILMILETLLDNKSEIEAVKGRIFYNTFEQYAFGLNKKKKK